MTGPTPAYGRPANRGAKLLIKAIGDQSQRSVARDLEVSPAHLNLLLHGRRLPSRVVAVTIKERFGVPVEAWGQKP